MSDRENGVIIIRCECGAELEASAAEVGQVVTCSACGRDVTVILPEAPKAPEPPTVAERAWHYIKDNRQFGPIPESGMHELFKAGTIGPQTSVWTESLQAWTHASSFQAFQAYGPAAPIVQQKSGMRLMLIALAVPFILVVVAIIGILAAILLPALAKGRESARRAACANNLKQMGLIMHMYANENKGRFPTIDNVKGNFMFEGDQVYPEYLTDVAVLGCPSDPGVKSAKTFRLRGNESHPGHSVGAPHPDSVTSESYAYLGWAVSSEREGLAALDAYRRASEGGLAMDLSVFEGEGNGGGSLIFRLSSDIERRIIHATPQDAILPRRDRPVPVYNATASSVIPIMWDWPSSHVPAGANVLYLDGHVEFVRYPGKFPMTEVFIEELRSFEPDLSPDVEPIVDR
jgi:prepilin-type processing-associated H-X9-DG protein